MNSDTSEWKRLVESYNRLVRAFRSVWCLLRAMVVMHPKGGNDIDLAKQRVRELQKRLVTVEHALKEHKIEGAQKQMDALDIELRVFKELLDRVDSTLTPLDIRKFCEKTHDTRDIEIEELLKFYLARNPLSDDDIDKVDFLATELSATRVGHKRVLRNVFDVNEVLEGLFESAVPQSEYEAPIIDEFKQAVRRIQNIEDVDTVLKSDVIKTMRDFKKEIREHLANPRILKSMAVYNVTLNNKLVELFEKESGGIDSSTGWVERVKTELDRSKSRDKEPIKAILDKVEDIRRGFSKKREQTGYNLDLIVEAAKQRKAISESMERIKEIRDPTASHGKPVFQRKTTQTLINEIFRALLSMDEVRGGKFIIPELNLDLAKMDPWERSVFIVDLDAMGEERRLYEVIQQAIVLSHKITEEYKQAKECLPRNEVVSLVGENLELAENLNEELQSILNGFDRRPGSAIKAIDLMKVKSALARNIKRLISLSRMEGFVG